MSHKAFLAIALFTCAVVALSAQTIPAHLWVDATATTIGATKDWTNRVEIGDINNDGRPVITVRLLRAVCAVAVPTVANATSEAAKTSRIICLTMGGILTHDTTCQRPMSLYPSGHERRILIL